MSSHKIIVGVDYGTTFTGVSYVFTNKDSTKKPDISQIKDWPGPNKHQSETEKTPSRIAYATDNRPFIDANKWGFQVTSNLTSYSWTKLLLDNSKASLQDDPDIAKIATNEGAGFLGLPNGYEAEDVCRDFLSEIYKYMLHHLNQRLSRETVSMTPFEFWFTTPSIWSDAAKAATKRAAYAAGFGSRDGDRIFVISEPEAAAIATLKYLAVDEQVHVGNGVLICDCGGGTVDITTYTIINTTPELEFEELLVGVGGKCGSTFIDRLFLDWMSATFGTAFDGLPAKKRAPGSKFMLEFERAKFEFGYSNDTRFEVSLNMPKAESSEYYDDEESMITFTNREMEAFFKPAVSMIKALLEQQVEQAKKESAGINVVILVGGFGNSRYLNDQLREWCDKKGHIRLLCPKDPQGAIVRGAALRGLEGNEARRKRNRRHYGVNIYRPFKEGVDRESDAIYDDWENRKLCRSNMNWLVPKGKMLDQDFVLKLGLNLTMNPEGNLRSEMKLFGSVLDTAPAYLYEPGITNVGTILTNFSGVNWTNCETKIIRGVRQYRVEHELHVYLAAKEGVLCVKAVCGDKELGTTEIEYKK
ncbi:hypothetical protein EG327_001066 [Venturia inaequalis]|uniref:Actin-like ATPase domain-containing protein n=1 Tax=Venturia inaequalis TaxID=5025 RepID=A0A8H3ZFX9_VENIN|nr:hypothetical protein EG327_001066 [Venturia inaequalis]